MPTQTTAIRLSIDTYRYVLSEAQALNRPAESIEQAVASSGFVRTLGGIDVYLAVRARVAAMSRTDLDSAVERLALQVVPAVRGCIYLVPRSEVPWALRTADLLSRSRREREHPKAGIREGEIEQLAEGVLEILREQGPLTTSKLRGSLPDGAVRSLGDAGKKVGISSPLPPALRHLEFGGLIERTLEGGKLDTERYLWRSAEQNPFDTVSLPEEPIAIFAHLAELFFRSAGIGTANDFAAWAGIGKRDARQAIDSIDLLEVAVPELELEGHAHPAHSDLITSAGRASAEPRLLPFEDNLIQLQGGAARLVDPAFSEIPVPSWSARQKATPLREAKHMSFRSVTLGGRIVGFWEYDPDRSEVVPGCFERLSKTETKKLDQEAAGLSAFVRDQLGHAKSFSLDTEEAQRGRVKELAALHAG